MSDSIDMEPVQSDEPIDRLTRMCAEMTVPLERPENDDVKAIVFLNDAKRGGIQMHGYEDTNEGMADLFVHMQAVFQSMGADLQFIGVPESPEGLN
jgi:hypothetical protein